jgi:F0F1-type ATP synthase assembly protein I
MSQSRDAPKASPPARPEGSAGMNQGMQVLSYLITGIGFYGLLGWLGDRWLGIHALLPVGIVVGAGLAVYLVVKRFGAAEVGPGTTTAAAAATEDRDRAATEDDDQTTKGMM